MKNLDEDFDFLFSQSRLNIGSRIFQYTSTVCTITYTNMYLCDMSQTRDVSYLCVVLRDSDPVGARGSLFVNTRRYNNYNSVTVCVSYIPCLPVSHYFGFKCKIIPSTRLVNCRLICQRHWNGGEWKWMRQTNFFKQYAPKVMTWTHFKGRERNPGCQGFRVIEILVAQTRLHVSYSV